MPVRTIMTPTLDAESSSRQILVTDDDPHDQLLFALAVEDSPTPVVATFTDDGESLLDQLRESAKYDALPDLVALDMRMPRRDGHEVLREIKADPAIADVDVVVFSSSNRQQDIERSIEAGALWHEVKPNTYEELVEFVDRIAQQEPRPERLPTE